MIKKFYVLIILICIFLLSLSKQSFSCSYKNIVPITFLLSDSDSWRIITSEMEKCGNFTAIHDRNYIDKQVVGMTVNPSQYTIVEVSNATLDTLINTGSLRSLDNLIEKYGQNLINSQKIVINGNIMAIAVIVNTQHLIYREDIFNELKIDVPKDYEEIFLAAEKINKTNFVNYPIGGAFKAGFNLGGEFINIYLGLGGTFFNGYNPSVNNSKGLRALRIMKKITDYMDSKYLISDSEYVQHQLIRGDIAMANLWASRAGAVSSSLFFRNSSEPYRNSSVPYASHFSSIFSKNNPIESDVFSYLLGIIKLSKAPAVKKGGFPATTLWWKGIAIAKNISEQEAKSAFKLVMAGIDPENLEKNKSAAIWLTDAFLPNEPAIGAISSALAGSPNYPASGKMSILHIILGNEIGNYLEGKTSAESTLENIESEYLISLRKKGLI